MEAEFQLAKERITKLHQSLTIENEQHVKAFDALKNEYENLTNELSQTKQAKDEIQSLFNQTGNHQILILTSSRFSSSC
jgi:hypothetical protein